jgi:hypothetical protein
MNRTIRCLALACILCLYPTNAWSQYLGGDLDDFGVSICTIEDGLILFGSTRSIGAGSDDLWLLRLDDEFKVIDNRIWGGVHRDIAAKVVSGCGNTYAAISAQWDLPGSRMAVQLGQYNADGTLLWSHNFNTPEEDRVYGLTRKTDCGYLVTGFAKGEGALGSAFLLNLNMDGSLEWSASFDLPRKDIGATVTEAEDGSIYWAININSFADKIADWSEYFSTETAGVILLKYSASGEEIWQQDLSTPKHDFASSLVSDGMNGGYLLGSSMGDGAGSFDMTLHRFDSEGNISWRKTYGGSSYEYGNSMTRSESGELLLVGTADRFDEDLGSDIQVILTDDSGNQIWEQFLGAENSEDGQDGLFLEDGTIAIIGSGQVGSEKQSDLYFGLLSSEGEEIDSPFNSFDFGISDVNVFPNPTSDFLYVDIDPEKYGETIELRLINSMGEEVFTESKDTGPTAVRFEPRIASGLYTYLLQYGTVKYQGRIIIE